MAGLEFYFGFDFYYYFILKDDGVADNGSLEAFETTLILPI
jgi:hypothetical protein